MRKHKNFMNVNAHTINNIEKFSTHTPTTEKIYQPPIGDCGASDTFFTETDSKHLQDVNPTNNGIEVSMPNGAIITSNAEGRLPLGHSLPAVKAHVFPDHMLQRSLIALSDLCNIGCTATLTATDITVKHGNEIVMKGQKQPHDKLWPLVPQPETHVAQHVISHQHNADYVAYWHAVLGSPTLSTILHAVSNGYLRLIPNLTTAKIRANLPVSMATARGHLDLNRQGQRSTKLPPTELDATSQDQTKEPDTPHTAMHARIIELDPINHADLTGKFPVQSAHGNNYLYVAVYKGYVHLEPQASRSAADHLQSTKRTMTFFRARGDVPTTHRMDNEISQEVAQYLKTECHMEIQLVPPGNHRTLKAERAIRTTKNHIIATLGTTNPSCPLFLWDSFIPQCEITLNTLLPSQKNPQLSAYEGLYGHPYDFLAHPLAPCGMAVLAFEQPQKRASWAPHGKAAFYLGPALDHYRTFRVYVTSTQSERKTDTVAWLPEPFIMPGASKEEALQAAIGDVTTAITNMTQTEGLSNHDQTAISALNQSITHSLKQLATMFHPQTIKNTTLKQEVAPTREEQRVEVAQKVGPMPAQRVEHMPAEQRVDPTQPEQREDSTTPEQGEENQIQAPAQQVAIISPTANRDMRPSTIKLRQPPRTVTNITHEEAAPQAVNASPKPTMPQTPRRSKRRRRQPTRYGFCGNAFINNNNQPSATTAVNSPSPPLLPQDIKYKQAIRGEDGAEWLQAASEEFIRLTETWQTIEWIHHHDKPRERTAAYYNPQCKYKLKQGQVIRRVRGTIGGNKVDYPGDVTAWTADMTTVKILLNAVVSEDAEWMTADISDFYLGTPLPRTEYMRIHRSLIPDDIMERYHLHNKMNNDHVMVAVVKGIYGLPQAGKLAQDRLLLHLAKHDYHPCPNSPCLLRHATRPIAFSLIVDDFGIKYKGREHALHLLNVLKEAYKITEDWGGTSYVGLTIAIDRDKRTAAISMPGYVAKALKRFGIVKAHHDTNSPLLYTPPAYGRRTQQLATEDTSAPLSLEETTFIQQVVGVFLYYARAVDPTLLTAINKIGSVQARPTQQVMQAIHRFLQYAATWPEATIVYHASDMRLHVQSDASYLSETNARSRAGGLHYLGNEAPTGDQVLVNGAIECVSTIIPTVVASAPEAEYAALYINGTTAEGIRNTLEDIGYPQQATPITADNTIAVGIATKTVKQRRSKAIDMRYHWIRDRVKQGHFTVTWARGRDNLADFFTKAHPVHHHHSMRKYYVHVPTGQLNAAQRRAKRYRAKSKQHLP